MPVLDRDPVVVGEVVVDRHLIERPVHVRNVGIAKVVLPVADADVEEVRRREQVQEARPSGSIRLAGMTLPGKHPGPPAVALQAAASGSRMKNGAAVGLRRLREIAGALAPVGICLVLGLDGCFVSHFSRV